VANTGTPHLDSTALAGGSGNSGAALASPASGADTGSGGAAQVHAASGVTGLVVSVNGCSLMVVLVDSTVDGTIRLICQRSETLTAGSSGAVAASALGGGSGRATSDAVAAASSGDTGSVRSAATTGADVVAAGPAVHAGRSADLFAGATARESGNSGSAAAAPSSMAVSGDGGAALATPMSGTTGAALAEASCLMVLTLNASSVDGDVELLCQPVATATSGNSGSVDAFAVGGSSGTAHSLAIATAESGATGSVTAAAVVTLASAADPAPTPLPRPPDVAVTVAAARVVAVQTPGGGSTPQSASLPFTGADSKTVGGLGAALIAAGLGLLLPGRRRRGEGKGVKRPSLG
jgi:hypothetical protein